MDIKILSGKTNSIIQENAYRQQIEKNDLKFQMLDMDKSIVDGDEISKDSMNLNKNEILTVEEQATLHVLFGSDKPKEMSLYGHNSLNHILKGQLFDVTS